MTNITKKEVLEFLKDLLIIGAIVLLIRNFIAEPFQISGQSMADSYYDREFIIVDRFSYLDIPKIKTGEVKRGDVVVFKPGVSEDKKYFIKRVIGLPGDNLKIEDGKVYLQKKGKGNFIELDEPYLNKENKNHTYVRGGIKNFEVPEGKYFLIGDNRNHSDDSRTCFNKSCLYSNRDSYIKKENIVGKVFLDLGYFNFKKFSFIQPDYNIDTTPKWFSSKSSFDYNID